MLIIDLRSRIRNGAHHLVAIDREQDLLDREWPVAAFGQRDPEALDRGTDVRSYAWTVMRRLETWIEDVGPALAKD